ncbi:unnamed protein product [Lampetra planeri]
MVKYGQRASVTGMMWGSLLCVGNSIVVCTAMAAQDEGWVLYYWPKLAGRAEFVRLVLEEAGEPYTEVNDGIEAMFFQGKHQEYPALAPPLIRKGSFTLSQTPVICRYLGRRLGLWPQSEEDEWHADQVNATIHDFIAEGRLAFHGKDFHASYFTQQEETKPYIEKFVKERLLRFLGHFEATLKANDGGQGFLVGDSLTYVDLALLHALRATAAQFPEEWAAAAEVTALLRAFQARVSARPRLAAYFRSERCKPFEGNSMM